MHSCIFVNCYAHSLFSNLIKCVIFYLILHYSFMIHVQSINNCINNYFMYKEYLFLNVTKLSLITFDLFLNFLLKV